MLASVQYYSQRFACLPTQMKKKLVFRQVSLICCTANLYHHIKVNTSRKRKVGTLTWAWEERRDQTRPAVFNSCVNLDFT